MKKQYPCDGPEGYCPFKAHYGADCYIFCGLGTGEDEDEDEDEEEIDDDN